MFTAQVLDLHWKQWASLGVSSHLNPSREIILDLEALIISTLTIRNLDQRLFEASLEWATVNRRWLNVFRMKRIGNFFASYEVFQKQPLLDRLFTEAFKSFITAPRDIPNKRKNRVNNSDNNQGSSFDIFESYKARGIVVEPDIKSPCLLQLFIRNFFGVDARAEMFLYFLAGRSGNSNSISAEIFLEQKNLYRILRDWVEAGIVMEGVEVGSPGSGLQNRDQWLTTFQIDDTPAYVNWPRIYRFMDCIAISLALPALKDDAYLASSFFRDIFPDAQYAATVTKTHLPQMKSFPGKEYYEPFANAALQIVQKVMQ